MLARFCSAGISDERWWLSTYLPRSEGTLLCGRHGIFYSNRVQMQTQNVCVKAIIPYNKTQKMRFTRGNFISLTVSNVHRDGGARC